MNGASQYPAVKEIFLHVQTNNTTVIAFYKKFGFEVTGELKNYYNNIPPPLDCFILTKTLPLDTPKS